MWRKMVREIQRRRKALLVFVNHRRILRASLSNDLIFLTPVSTSNHVRHVEHYYHFLFELVLPLNELLDKTPTSNIFMLKEFGILTEIIQSLFPGRIRIVDESYMPKEIKSMNLIGVNPNYVHVSRKTIEKFRRDIANLLGVNQVDAGNKVLLIERLPPDSYYIEKAKIKGSGASRRSISNHDKLKSLLGSITREPFVFQNIQLEKMTFDEQVDCFSKAKVVIGQHGAGLANCIWMNPGSTVVELSHDLSLKHFSILSHAKRHSYHVYKLSGNHCDIDTDDFTNWIMGDAHLREFFELRDSQRPEEE